jgi:hypothetical protein
MKKVLGLRGNFWDNFVALSDISVRAIKSRERPYKIFDGRGLYLLRPLIPEYQEHV